jgi:sialidase-1
MEYRNMKRTHFLFLLFTASLTATACGDQALKHVDVFVSGKDGYAAYRIPAIVTTPNGAILAFAEARKHNLSDPGGKGQEIDLVLKRSTDGGATWSPMKVVEHSGELWSSANPCTVVDRSNSRVWVFYLRCRPGRGTAGARPGTDDVANLARWSDDNGSTWSEPIDQTTVARDMADGRWRISVPGPGSAIQDRKGRLIVPMWRFSPWDAFVLISEDHGRTWQRGACVPGLKGGDEDQVVELADGRILLDIRQQTGPHRWVATSSDGGRTWTGPRPGQTVTPVCCAIQRYTLKSAGEDGDRVVWTGPLGPGRNKLVVRVSCDEAQTFRVERLISPEPSAYSALTLLNDKSVGVLWERGNYRLISFTRLDRKWVLGD